MSVGSTKVQRSRLHAGLTRPRPALEQQPVRARSQAAARYHAHQVELILRCDGHGPFRAMPLRLVLPTLPAWPRQVPYRGRSAT